MPPHDPHEHHDPFPGFPVDPDVTREVDVPPPRLHTAAIAVVSAGGALGAVARWAVAQTLPHHHGEVPWATLLTNVAGCFLIGVLMVVVIEVVPGRALVRPFLGTGVLGGFTTFSTYAMDTRGLLAADRPAVAALYLAGTLAVGLLAAVAGLRLTERVVR
jgi:CrcB protein